MPRKCEMMNNRSTTDAGWDIPAMEKSEFMSVYDSVKDNLEAVKELDDIMQEVIDRMTPLVERYEALYKKNPDDVSEEELLELENEKFKIETDRLERIQKLLKKEVDRKQSEAKDMMEKNKNLLQKSFRMKTGKKIYPNDSCPCGSGKKYKKCCGRTVFVKPAEET